MRSIEAVEAYLSADIPVLVEGPPGTGKTATFESMARRKGWHLETLIGSTIDPVDVGGYLLSSHGKVVSDPPPWATRIKAALDHGTKPLLFLDELSCAPPSTQAALLRVVNERRVGNLDLIGMLVAAASNPADSATAEGDVGPAMSNRWAHVDWTVDVSEWVAGTLSNWGAKQPAGYAEVASSVTGFLTRSPTALLKQGVKAWPSPRSWTHGIKAVIALDKGLKSTASRIILAGLVGDATASEWSTYVSESDLPSPEEVLCGKANVPTRGDRISATIQAVAGVALSEHANREERVRMAWDLLAKQRQDLVIGAAKALLNSGYEVPDVAIELGNKIRKMS